MSQENIPIQDFITEINKGKYVIPYFQRPFDWGPGMVNDLFNSILHEYYAGTILLWRLGDSERKTKMWNELWGAVNSEKPEIAILDGQQRLSSIYYALYAPHKKFPNRDSYYYFFIDLEKMILGEEESITYRYYPQWRKIDSFKNKKEEWIQKGLFPLCLISDRQFLKSKDYQDWLTQYVDSINYLGTDDKPTTLAVYAKINSILSFTFSTETLENKEAKEVCTVFANLNSKGLKLSIFDLMNAFLFPYDIQLRDNWDKLTNFEKLKDVDSEMKVYILKLMSLYKQRYCSSKYLYNLIPGSSIKDRKGNKSILIKDNKEFNKLWKDSLNYSEKARKMMMRSGFKDFGAIKSTYIPNTTLLPVLGALLLSFDKDPAIKDMSEDKFIQKIYKWYWCAVISGDYSGSSDSIMSQDYREVLDWLKDDGKIPERVNKIDNTFIEKSLNLDKVKNTNNSRYCAILNLLALKSSRDWFTNQILGNYPVNQINDHHIFPTGCKLEKDSDMANSILNRTLLYDETNRKIKDKCPKDYTKDIINKIKGGDRVEEIMETHLISPIAFKCMKANDFDGFINERKNTICKELKKVIGIT